MGSQPCPATSALRAACPNHSSTSGARLAFDQTLFSEVLRIFMQSVFSSLRRRARKTLTATWLHYGSVCFLQRSGGSINLNVHFHSLVLDGVYVSTVPYEPPRFIPLPPPSDEEVTCIIASIAQRVERLLVRKGLLGEHASTDPDPLETEESLLPQLYSASVQGRIASGPHAGQRLLRLGNRIGADQLEAITGPRCASVQGFSFHADVCVPAVTGASNGYADMWLGLRSPPTGSSRPPMAGSSIASATRYASDSQTSNIIPPYQTFLAPAYAAYPPSAASANARNHSALNSSPPAPASLRGEPVSQEHSRYQSQETPLISPFRIHRTCGRFAASHPYAPVA
jgi:hypothetical protein